ncbi:MAG: hypothetical protein ACNA8W_22990, partial [Bradymonadaceae bacterium]
DKARRLIDEPVTGVEDDGAPRSAGLSNQTLGWGLSGMGSAIVVGTLVYHMKILGEQRELKEPGSRERFLTLQEEYDKPHNRARVLVPTFYVLGAAALGTGGYFLMNEAPSGDQQAGSFLLAPTLGPGQAGASLSMSF